MTTTIYEVVSKKGPFFWLHMLLRSYFVPDYMVIAIVTYEEALDMYKRMSNDIGSINKFLKDNPQASLAIEVSDMWEELNNEYQQLKSVIRIYEYEHKLSHVVN